MLTCPICNQQVSEREMQEGRCSECMGLLSWQGFQTDSHQEGLLEEFPSATASAPDQPVQNVDATAEPGDSRAITGDVEKPVVAVDESADSTSESDQSDSPTIRASDDRTSQEDTDREVVERLQTEKKTTSSNPANRSIGLERTLQSQLMRSLGEDKNIAQTIAPRELSVEELGQIDEEWETKGTDSNDINASLDPNSTLPGNKSSLVVKPRAVGGVHESQADGNDYQMMEALGKGGVGVVYSARQASIDRNVALKMLHPQLSQIEEYRNKFLAEAVVIGDLDHPQIVPIYDLGKNENDELFYTMKKVEGTPWSEKLDKLSLEENLEILLKICNAIAFAHFRGVVHRDLKPDNVMLGDFGEVLVMDWGLALVTEESSKRATIVGTDGLGGTPAYMAPEMVTGPVEKITHRSDIYLLGALLFRILTGKTPHVGKNVKECVKAAAKNLLQPTEVRGELIEIALTAMATRPEDRYSTALEFRDALRSFEAHAESLKLTAQAEKDLAKARENGDYQLFARSVFGFEEAIALWGANSTAHDGIVRTREAYAQAALSNGDFDLGLSVLDREVPSHLPLVKKLEAEQKDRDTRQRQLQRTKLVFRWASFTFVLMLFLACVVIYVKMNAAVEAREDERLAKIQANLNAGRAIENERLAKAANEGLQTANESLAEEQRKLKLARDLAERAKDQAIRSEEIAEENRKLAEAQTYLSQIALAAKKIEENRFDEARQILSAYQGSHLVGWEWGHLWDSCNLSEADQKLDTVLQDVSSSHDGKLFAVGGDDGLVRLWKTRDFRDLQNPQHAPLWENPPRPGSDSAITTVEFSPRSELLAVGDSHGIVSLLTVSENAEIKPLLDLPRPWDSQAPIPISCLRFSYSEDQTDPDDRTRWLLVGSESGEAAVWDLDAGAWLQFPRGSTLRGHRREVRDIVASPDQRFILTAGEDDKIQIWSNTPRTGTQPVSIAIDPDSSQSVERYEIWKTVYWMHEGAVLCLDTATDDQGNLLVVSGGRDGSIQLWNLNDVPSDNLTTVPPRTTLLPSANNAAIQDVCFFRQKSRGGDKSELRLLTCGDDRTVQLWTINQEALFTYRSPSTSRLTTPVAALKLRFRGHGSRVTACDLIPTRENVAEPESSEPRIISVGEDHRVMLWNQSDYHEQEVFELETEAQILDATFDHDSNQIASVTSKGVLSITDLISNRSALVNEQSLTSNSWKEGHDFLANRGLFVPAPPALPGQPQQQEHWFISAGIDGKVIVWDLDRGVSIREYDQSGRTSIIALSPNRERIVTGGPGNLALLGELPRVMTASSAPEATTEMTKLSGHKDLVTAACFSADGRWILTGDKQGELRVWPNSANVTQKDQIEPIFSTRAHSEEITGIHALGASIVTTSRDYSVKIWRITESTDSSVLKLTSERRLRGTGEVIESSVSPRGQYLACVRQRYETPASLETTESQQQEQLVMTSEITVSDLSSNPPQEWTLSKTDCLILATDFFQHKNWLLLTDNHGNVSLWDWEAGQEHSLRFNTDAENFCTRVDASGTRLVTTGGRQVQLWDFDQKRMEVSSIQATLGPQRLLGPHYGISRVSFSNDDSWIVTGDRNGYVKLWQRTAGLNDYHLQYRLPIRTNRSIAAARFSPGSPRQLLTAWEDLLILWEYDGENWVEEKRRSLAEKTGVSYAEYSPSGTKLLIGRHDGTCEVWNAADLSPDVSLQGAFRHQLSINCGAFSDDERLIVTGSDDKNARGILWKSDQGEWSAVAKIAGHSGGITSVAFSPVHQLRLLTGSRDGTAKLWDISQWTATDTRISHESSPNQVTIKELLTLRGHDEEVTAVDFDHTGQYLLTASRDGKTIRWASAQIDPALVARLDSLALQPGQPVYLCRGFEILDPVAPALEGGLLSLKVGPLSGSTESENEVSDLSLSVESGDFRLEKSTERNQTEVILKPTDASRRSIGKVIQGWVSENELSLPFELQISPGTTNLELMDFLNHLVCTLPVTESGTGETELVLTLRLGLLKTESSTTPEATITLRIIRPESELETNVPESAD